MTKRILLGIAAAAVLIALLAYSQMRTPPLKVSGFIEADEIRLVRRADCDESDFKQCELRSLDLGVIASQLATDPALSPMADRLNYRAQVLTSPGWMVFPAMAVGTRPSNNDVGLLQALQSLGEQCR